MDCLTYSRMNCRKDPDIPRLLSVFQMPEISRFYTIDPETYFPYVTDTENVYFYKVYRDGGLVGAIHLEKQETTVFLSILVFPEFQRMGIGTRILKDVLGNGLGLDCGRIRVSVDEKNIPSRKLFESMGFVAASREEELINYVRNRD